MIECINLCKYYEKKKNQCKAINNINLKINDSEFVAIMGSSGAGKTTLINLFSGLINPTSGKIIIDNENISSFSDSELATFRRKKIGMVFQSYGLIENYSVEENILIALTYSGLKNKEKHAKIINELEDFNMQNMLSKKVKKLSGGEKQRVAIIRALIKNPDIILADEPTGSLDKENADKILHMLDYANKEKNKTVIIVTHDIDIANICTRLIELKQGVIVNDKDIH